MSERTPLTLWYREPARTWVEALPIGNGRLGAMIYGGYDVARLQLNEATLWSGGPREWDNPRAAELLPAVREAIFQGDYTRADALCQQMQGPFNQSYQPLGELLVSFADASPPSEYRRELDLERAVATTGLTRGGVSYRCEALASHPDQVIVVRLESDARGQVSFSLRLDSLLRHEVQARGPDTLLLGGQCPAHVDPNYLRTEDPVRYEDGAGMRFVIRLRALVEGGTVEAEEGALQVRGADAVTLLLSAATSYAGYDRCPVREGRDAGAIAARHLEAAAAWPYAALLERHIADHQALFRRVSLDLGASPDRRVLPTDERIIRFADDGDPELAALLYQYGRYLLIASSRPGGQPANLQGIWNEHVRPPWSANYTLNINAEMNYWPAESCALPECHEPLFDLVEELAENGRGTAQVNYGAAGWVAHHNTDLWRQSAPVGDGNGDPVWANWPMGGAWLCQHLWEHYAFTGDEAYLRERAWPIMAGAARFCLDWLIEDEEGHLITAPSTSPEHMFYTPEGERAAVSAAATMDMAIIWDLFTNCIEAAQVLGVEPAFGAPGSGAGEALPIPDWRTWAVAGVVGGLSGGRGSPPPRVAPLWAAPRAAADARGDARAGRGGTAGAGDPGRCQHRLVDGLEGEPVGAAARWRPRLPPDPAPVHAGRGDRGRDARWRRAVRQPARRTPALPDRRQFRLYGGRGRDAAAEPRGCPAPAARAAGRVAEWIRVRPARTRRVRGGRSVAGGAAGLCRDPFAAGESVPGAGRGSARGDLWWGTGGRRAAGGWGRVRDGGRAIVRAVACMS